MRPLIFLLSSFSLGGLTYGQVAGEPKCTDDVHRVGPKAEHQQFRIISEKKGAGYYEVVSDPLAAYLQCGKKVEIHRGEVIKIDMDLFQGSYDGHSGVWGETFVDFDGVGPDPSSVVYVFLNDLKLLPGAPKDGLLNDRIRWSRVKNSFDSLSGIGILSLVIVVLIVPLLIIRSLSRRKQAASKAEPFKPITRPLSVTQRSDSSVNRSDSNPIANSKSSSSMVSYDWVSPSTDQPITPASQTTCESFLDALEKNREKQQKIFALDAEITWRKMHGHESSDLFSGDLERLERERDNLSW